MGDDAPSTVKRIVSALLGGLFDFTGLGNGRPGYWARSLAFDPADDDVRLRGKTALITGGNSGIGKAAAIGLARRGAEVWLLCRDAKRGRDAVDEIRRATRSDLVSPESCDMSSPASIQEFARRFPVERVDILVHNAGAIVPERTLTPEGVEATLATNVVGPFLLTHLLLPKLGEAGEAGARVIFVSSSDAYRVKLSLDDLEWAQRPYDGMKAFEMAKRLQIVLADVLDEKLAARYVHCASMNPGWVDTDGLRRAQPALHARARRLLRTTEQGADTIVWLATSARAALPQGLFYMDRRARQPHVRSSTYEDPIERGRVFGTCMKLAGSLDPSPPKPKQEYTVGHVKQADPGAHAKGKERRPAPLKGGRPEGDAGDIIDKADGGDKGDKGDKVDKVGKGERKLSLLGPSGKPPAPRGGPLSGPRVPPAGGDADPGA